MRKLMRLGCVAVLTVCGILYWVTFMNPFKPVTSNPTPSSISDIDRLATSQVLAAELRPSLEAINEITHIMLVSVVGGQGYLEACVEANKVTQAQADIIGAVFLKNGYWDKAINGASMILDDGITAISFNWSSKTQTWQEIPLSVHADECKSAS